MVLLLGVVPMFSFSSSSETLVGGLALADGRGALSFDCGCSSVTDETRRCGVGVGVAVESGFAEDERESEESLPVGVGVAIDARGFIGGGPIEPSIPREEDFMEDGPTTEEFMRALLVRAGVLTDGAEGGSADSLRSLVRVIPSLPESEITDEGRETVGVVVNTAESRR